MMWYELFIFGNPLFWGLVGIEIICLFIFIACDCFGKASTSLFIFVLLLILFGKKGTISDFLLYAKNNPFDILRWAVLYVIFGCAWSLLKMYFSTKEVSRKIVAIKEKYLLYVADRNQKIEAIQTTLADEQIKLSDMDKHGENTYQQSQVIEKLKRDLSNNSVRNWDDYIRDNLGSDIKQKTNFNNYRSKIIYWIMYWPISGLWTLINDPFTKFIHWLYDTFLIGAFRKIHEMTIGKAMQL